jgi:hypothetical protein
VKTTFLIRLDAKDKRLFKRAAQSAGISLAEFIRSATREKAEPARRMAACLTYPEIQIDPQAEIDSQNFIQKYFALKS